MPQREASTPRGRVELVLRHEVPDRTPFTIYREMVPQCETERALRNAGLCLVTTLPVARAITPHVTRSAIHYEERGRPRIRRVISTPAGDLTSLEEPQYTIPWLLEKPFKSPADYRLLLSLVNDRRYEPDYGPFVRLQESLGGDGIARAPIELTPLQEIMVYFMGIETFAVEWAERRDEVMRLYDALAAKHRELFPIVARSPALHANYGGNEIPEAMGRERFESFVLPLYAEAAVELHAAGKLLGAHLDGNNRAWADLVAGSGLDYVEAFTPAPNSDMTLTDALAAWPDKVVWANFPSSLHLADNAVITAAARSLVREAAPGNRFILGVTEDIPEQHWRRSLAAISRGLDD
jgi:hypothetical protein